MDTKLTKCPFCDHPRTVASGFDCQKCGMDLIWMIPWEEGGGALPMLESAKAPAVETTGAVPLRNKT